MSHVLFHANICSTVEQKIHVCLQIVLVVEANIKYLSTNGKNIFRDQYF